MPPRLLPSIMLRAHPALAPTASILFPNPPALKIYARGSSSVTQRKTRSLYFQSLTHSSQFQDRDIPSIFLPLHTLCQKHPGVGVSSVFQTPFSVRFDMQLPRNHTVSEPHRATTLGSHCFASTGGWPARLLFVAKSQLPFRVADIAANSVANYSFTGLTPWHIAPLWKPNGRQKQQNPPTSPQQPRETASA